MAKIRIFSVRQVRLDTGGITHVSVPKAGFTISVSPDKAQRPLIDDPKILAALEAVAAQTYKAFQQETTGRMRKFEKLFAGMLAKGASEKAVARQISQLKLALEKEVPKWEKAGERRVLAELAALAKKKRQSRPRQP